MLGGHVSVRKGSPSEHRWRQRVKLDPRAVDMVQAMARRIAFVVAVIQPATEMRQRGRLPERGVCLVYMDGLSALLDAQDTVSSAAPLV